VDENYNTTSPAFLRVLVDDFNDEDWDWNSEQEKSGIMSFGPFQMAPGDDYRVVVAFAHGAPTLREAIDVGRAYLSGYSNQFLPRIPLPYDVTDLDGNLIAGSGSEVSKAQKDAFLAVSKDRVFDEAAKAIRLWKSNNVRAGAGTFDIPFAPASPSLTGFSENDRIRLTWGEEAANDSRVSGISGYRIYRDYKRTTEITEDSAPTDTTFFLLAEVGSSAREYIDNTVARGDNYYYYVTAVSTDGIESSPFLNRTGTSARREDEALTATRSPSADWQSDDPNVGVVVVPNPFHASAADKYDGNRINFLNLPAYANIHIYTVLGDRVQTIVHDRNTGDRDWLRQDTFSNVQIVSGIYLYVVEELDGPNGNTTGEKKIGKFVVIK
jgi:hypothetical protein